MTNLDRKARCCRADLRFLLSLLADSPHREKVEGRLRQIEQINGQPDTNETIKRGMETCRNYSRRNT
jgi:hypothetical protein